MHTVRFTCTDKNYQDAIVNEIINVSLKHISQKSWAGRDRWVNQAAKELNNSVGDKKLGVKQQVLQFECVKICICTMSQ